MTVTSGITLSNRNLVLHGKLFLSHVPSNISLLPAHIMGLQYGAFLGAASSESKSRLVCPLGVLESLRFMCCFRFKLWWMTQRMGTRGRDVPLETQFLLVEGLADESNMDQTPMYAVFLPLLEGPFRASLQGNEKDEIELCLESGDSTIQTAKGTYSVFIHAGRDPFQVISDAVRTVEMHQQTFQQREKKKMPKFLDWFGWCTWDAFYTDVTAEGVEEGLKSLTRGGTPPRFVIIDDGWQSVGTDQQPVTATVSNGKIFASRLTHIKENFKFQKNGKEGHRQEDPALGLRHIIREIKTHHNVRYVMVWHAITGYWGGVKPGVTYMENYESALQYPVKSPGIVGHEPELQPDEALHLISIHGCGLVNPKKVFRFYDELHSYLAAAGVDGVKVDVQNILETLGSGFGGRVALTRQYHQALEASVARNFPDNCIIACMSHNTDGLYSSKQTAVVRASDDFFPRDPASHTIHIASVAYNSLFLGEFMQPDWDMFHSLHPAAEYHAAARAVGGCAIYVSDKPGNHNFDVIKKLVLPDGSVLRAKLPGRPSRDCLFSDPARDGKSLLKIWNMNKYTGVIGVFNCQGAGWCRTGKINVVHDEDPETITGSVHAQDVDFLPRIAGENWNGDCVTYSHREGELVRLPKSAALPVTLKVLEYEIFTVTPIKDLGQGRVFAPIGLLRMFNAGGAIESLEYQETKSSCSRCVMKIHGCGELGVYSSVWPTSFIVNGKTAGFSYDATSGLARVELPFFTPPTVQDEEGFALIDVVVEI